MIGTYVGRVHKLPAGDLKSSADSDLSGDVTAGQLHAVDESCLLAIDVRSRWRVSRSLALG